MASVSTPVRAVLSPSMAPDQRGSWSWVPGFCGSSPSAVDRPVRSRRAAPSRAMRCSRRTAAGWHSWRANNGRRELRVYDFDTRTTSIVVSGRRRVVAAVPELESGRPSHRLPAYTRHLRSLPHRHGERRLTVSRGRSRRASGAGRRVRTSRPTAPVCTSRAGSGSRQPCIAWRLQPEAQPQAVTNLTRHVHEGLVSPDGKWLAFRSNSEIWTAPMGISPIADAQVTRVSTEGGRVLCVYA